MNLLDMRTVLLSYIISNAICAAIMASLWWQNRRRSPELVFWLADFIMQFTGVLLLTLRGILPDFFTIVLSNTLVIGGTLLLFIGLEHYTRKAGPQWYNYLYLAAFIFVQMYFVYVQPSLPARNNNISLAILVFCSQCAWLLLRRVEPDMRPDTWRAGMVFGIFCLVTLVRVSLDLVMPPGNDFFKSGLYDTLGILAYQMLYISLTFTLLLMVYRRLLTTLKSDITERKLAEAALKISEEKFSKAFQTSPYAITITRVEDGKFIEVNDAFTSITGIPHEEALAGSSIGLNMWVNEDDRQSVVAALRAGRAVAGQEFLFRRKTGEVITGIFSAQMIQLSQGPCILSSIDDITERKLMEDALRESEARFHQMFEKHDAIMLLIEPRTGLILDANQAAEKFYGYTKSKLCSMSINDINTLSPGQVAAERQKTLIGKKKFFIFPHKLASGEERVVEVHSSPIMFQDKQVLFSIIHDITERKQVEEQLRLDHAIMANIDEGVYIIRSSDGTILTANRQFEEMFGYDPGELIGKHVSIVNAPTEKDAQETANEIMEELKKHSIWRGLVLNIKKDGTTFWSDASVTTLTSEHADHGNVWVSVHRDITERRQMEDALQKSEERYRMLFNSMTEGFALHELIFDENGEPCDYRFLNINPAFEQLTGLKGERIIGKGQREVLPDEDPFWFNIYRKVALTGEPIRLEHYSPPLRKYYEVYAYCPIPNQFAVIFTDITERKQAEKEIRQLNITLEQRVEERTRELRDTQEQLVRHETLAVLGQLAGSVGHELRNPLGVINNAVYYLKLVQPDADAKIKSHLGMIEKETRVAEKIITDLLEFARIKSMDREPVSVSELIRQTLERFPVPPTVEMALEIPPDLPQVYVDPHHMVQVLGNLIVNACQAMPGGGQLSVSGKQLSANTEPVESKSLNTNWLLITVQDTGVGISPKNMKKLFEPLFTTKTKGIGLGLAVSKKLVEANGGRIEVHSEAGVGSTFTVILPIEQDVK